MVIESFNAYRCNECEKVFVERVLTIGRHTFIEHVLKRPVFPKDSPAVFCPECKTWTLHRDSIGYNEHSNTVADSVLVGWNEVKV
jgi:ribosomal protein L44E